MRNDSTTPSTEVDLSPSRSQQRRDALAVLELAEQLVALTPTRLRKANLPEALHAEVENVRRISAHIARKRQMAFLAKQLRRQDDDVLDAIRAGLGVDREQHKRDVAAMHRLEHLRQRLLDEGDTVIEELANEHPALDRQHLRSLVRQSHRESEKNKPPRASREILRYLREL